jgi:hypothetical protein
VSANGKIGTRLRKTDKKAVGTLVDAQVESCPVDRTATRDTNFENGIELFVDGGAAQV